MEKGGPKPLKIFLLRSLKRLHLHLSYDSQIVLPYVVHTDASTRGLGAALHQGQDGQTRIVTYASRDLLQSKARYPAYKLEFFALKWAITEKFHDYIYDIFPVITDNNPLWYVLTKAKLDGSSYRW